MGGLDGLDAEFTRRLTAMQAAARSAGFEIGFGSGRRSVEEQIALRKANGCPDVWTSPASSCRVPTAIPGRSNHNHGLAMDLTGPDGQTLRRDRHPEAFAWLAANMGAFGLHLPVKGEDWHAEMTDDDGARGPMTAAQQAGAIGYDVNWLEAGGDPTARRDEMLQSYLDVMTQAHEQALVGSPAQDPMLGTPTPDMPTTPDMGLGGIPGLEVPEQIDATAMAPRPAGGAGGGGAPVAGAGGDDALANARLIAQVGRQMGAPDRAIQIALAAGLVESNLRNVNHGDRDSLGIFQQRPSQGWGTPEQVMDPTYAATQFYTRLLGMDWQSMAPGDAAQAVQRSAFPGRYAERFPEAQSIFAQIQGQF